MFPVSARCPHCQASLMAEGALIDGYPAIALSLEYLGEETPLRLSSIYGSFRYASQTPVVAGDITELKCPHCGKSLITDSPCDVCTAPMAMLHLEVGGDVLFCSRRGCKVHRAETDDLERSMIALTQGTSTPRT
jgi:hypothetical protein